MRVYLAASFSRREEMRQVRKELRDLGVDVQARWLDESQPPAQEREKWLRENACIDRVDVLAADLLVRFTDDLATKFVPSHLATGSRFVEMGMALSRGIPVVVVGGNQCLFDRLPGIVHLKNTQELMRYLAPYEVH